MRGGIFGGAELIIGDTNGVSKCYIRRDSQPWHI